MYRMFCLKTGTVTHRNTTLSTWMGRAGANATLNTSQGPNKLNEKFVKF